MFSPRWQHKFNCYRKENKLTMQLNCILETLKKTDTNLQTHECTVSPHDKKEQRRYAMRRAAGQSRRAKGTNALTSFEYANNSTFTKIVFRN